MKNKEEASAEQQITPVAGRLKNHTNARVGLRRSGISISTEELLKFQLDFARARDAVQREIDETDVFQKLQAIDRRALLVYSAASSLQMYLQRPDLGRILSVESEAQLKARSPEKSDICIVLTGGLSSAAIHQAFPLIERLAAALQGEGTTVAPLVLAHRGRVAIGDPIGALLKAQLSLVLVGERPGMSSSNSLGAYLTYAPQPGKTDESRNCLSNIREGGLSVDEAVFTLLSLIRESTRLKLSGVQLKDRSRESLTLKDGAKPIAGE